MDLPVVIFFALICATFEAARESSSFFVFFLDGPHPFVLPPWIAGIRFSPLWVLFIAFSSEVCPYTPTHSMVTLPVTV